MPFQGINRVSHLHVDLEDVERRDGEMGGAGAKHAADSADRIVLRREDPHPLPPPFALAGVSRARHLAPSHRAAALH